MKKTSITTDSKKITTSSLQHSCSSSSYTTTNDNDNNDSGSWDKNCIDLINLGEGQQWSSMKSFVERYTSTSSTPSGLCPDKPTPTNPQLAKDAMYAKAVLENWKRDIHTPIEPDAKETETVGTNFIYSRSTSDGDGGTTTSTHLNGYVVVDLNLTRGDNKVKKSDSISNQAGSDVGVKNKKAQVPAIILFHTGAGPQDVFLRWKADMLVRDPIFQDDDNDGCIVLIADIVGDSTGWTWTDRDRYDETRKDLLQRTVLHSSASASSVSTSPTPTPSPQRWKLRETVAAAVEALKSIKQVDDQRIAAMGWCLGGHPVLELGRMKLPGVNTLVTFHGVFDGINDGDDISSSCNDKDKDEGHNHGTTNEQQQKCVLICNGRSDPFVSRENLDFGKQAFERHSWNVDILDFEHVKHGFTNPAQDYNPSDAFAFDGEASEASWNAAKKLLRKQFFQK